MWGQLPYLAIIHMSIEGYSGPDGLTKYKYEMITALEKGPDRANELQYRRIVMGVNGLRFSNMPWQQAENVALAVVRLNLNSGKALQTVREIVFATSLEQDKERREKAL